MRRDGSHRQFGGVNVIFFGDWWQLRPVGGTALFSYLFTASPGAARSGMEIFWETGAGTIRRLWELVEPMRWDDRWYNAFLASCREREELVRLVRLCVTVVVVSPLFSLHLHATARCQNHIRVSLQLL